MKPLSPGDNVWFPDQRNAGQVIGEDTPRSYNVETSTGVYRRNRRHIIPLPATDTSVEDNVNTQSNNVSSGLEITPDTEVVKSKYEKWEVSKTTRSFGHFMDFVTV